MSDEPHSRRRAFLLTLGLFGLVGIGLLLLLLVIEQRPWFNRPSTAVISSDEPWHAKVFDPSQRVPLPQVVSRPVPDAEITVRPSSGTNFKEVRIKFPGSYFGSSNQFYEIFTEDASGTVHLPGGDRITIEALAINLPSDVKLEPSGDPPDRMPEWIDPATGNPLEKPDDDSALWSKPRSVSDAYPRVHVRLKVEGETPIRWMWPSAHSARTLRQAIWVSPESTPDADGFFSFDLKTWHQAPLDLGIQFAFGEPEEQTLPLEKGANIQFGDDAFLQIVEEFPYGHRHTSWIDRGANFTVFSTPQRPARKSFVLSIWPPPQAYLIDLQPDPRIPPRRNTGFDGVHTIDLRRKQTQFTETKVFRYPRLGRAVFRLDRIPRLPEVDNLFESPIPKVRVRSPYYMLRHATDAAEVKKGSSPQTNVLGQADYPRIFENTTPAQLIREFEEISGVPLFYDPDTMEISDKRPPGLLERVKDWWQTTRPSWFP